MKYINLSQNKMTIVDDEDFEFLNEWKWHLSSTPRHRYAVRNALVNGKKTIVRMHRILMGASAEWQVDHKNGNSLDNRRTNLRLCTHSENQRNQKAQCGTSSRFKGVTWDKSRNKWSAKIKVDKKQINLGRFSNEIEAAAAYDLAAIKYHKEFARLNTQGDVHV